MLLFIIRLLVAFFLSLSPLIAAEEPEETLNVTAAPEFQIDIVSAFQPIIEENYWVIQGFVAIYLVLEFYLFPFLDQCEELAKEKEFKSRYAKTQEWKRQYWEERKKEERYEREREKELEAAIYNEDSDYLADYDY